MAKKKIPERDEETGKFIPKDTPEEDNKPSEVMSVEDAAREDDLPIEKEVETEEPAKTEPAKEEKKEIDPELMKKEIAEKVSRETVEKIAQALTGQDKTTQAQKDKYEEVAEQFFAKHGRNPSWFELVPFIKEDLKADMKKEAEIEKKTAEEQKKQVESANLAREGAFNKYIDEQLNDLLVQGKLPKPVDPKNEKDPGVVARKALFQTMMEVNQKRVSENKPPIYSLKEIYYEHYKAPNAQPAGWDAPVSAGRTNMTPEPVDDFSYADIHKPKSFVDLLMRR